MSGGIPPLGVIVVAYGRPDLLDGALHAISEGPERMSVVVVDNSSDPDVATVANQYGCTYVDPGTNLGFARGVNLGLDHIDGSSDVLLLNPDAIVDQSTLHSLHTRLRQERHTACVAPNQVDLEGRRQRVQWPFPSPLRAWLSVLGMHDRLQGPTFLIGSVLLLRREALDEVGQFDERFFLYSEEADWEWRAVQAGWGTRLCDELLATHIGAATSPDGRRRDLLFSAGLERYIRKWHGRWGWQSFRAAEVLGATLRTALGSASGRRRAARRALIYARGPVRALSRGAGGAW